MGEAIKARKLEDPREPECDIRAEFALYKAARWMLIKRRADREKAALQKQEHEKQVRRDMDHLCARLEPLRAEHEERQAVARARADELVAELNRLQASMLELIQPVVAAAEPYNRVVGEYGKLHDQLMAIDMRGCGAACAERVRSRSDYMHLLADNECYFCRPRDPEFKRPGSRNRCPICIRHSDLRDNQAYWLRIDPKIPLPITDTFTEDPYVLK